MGSLRLEYWDQGLCLGNLSRNESKQQSYSPLFSPKEPLRDKKGWKWANSVCYRQNLFILTSTPGRNIVACEWWTSQGLKSLSPPCLFIGQVWHTQKPTCQNTRDLNLQLSQLYKRSIRSHRNEHRPWSYWLWFTEEGSKTQTPKMWPKSSIYRQSDWTWKLGQKQGDQTVILKKVLSMLSYQLSTPQDTTN